MAGKNWQASGKNSIPARAVMCLFAAALPCESARGAPLSGRGFAPASYVGAFDPNLIWELLIGAIVITSFLAAVGLWILTALRRAERAKLRRNAFISSALNNLNQGVMMTNAEKRVVFCNDRFLEIYGLNRSDITADMTSREMVELRRQRGMMDVSFDEFVDLASRPEGHITELPNGNAVLAKIFRLPNGGTIVTHEDCTEQRKL